MKNETEQRLDEIKGRVERVLDANNDLEKAWNGVYWTDPDHAGAFDEFDDHALPDMIWLLKKYTQALSWGAAREKRLAEVKDERNEFYRMSFLEGQRFVFQRIVDRRVSPATYSRIKWRLKNFLSKALKR